MSKFVTLHGFGSSSGNNSEVKINTVTKKLSSNATTITFEGLTQEPKIFAIIPTGNITLSSTRYVTGVMYDGEITSGTYAYRSSSQGTSYYSASYFTWTYSDGTLSIKTSSSTNGGNFSSSVTYKLVYVEIPEGSGSSSGGVSLPTLTNEGSASDLLSGKQLIDSKGNIVIGNYEGAELNFKIVGGTSQPSNPTENTIWVNTSTDISSWVFSTKQPENPNNGMVWIPAGNDSSVKFNVLKKNDITIYPQTAKQYINGAFVSVSAKIYQGNKWIDFVTYLYHNGEEFIETTGGWTVYSLKHSGGASSQNKKPNFTIGSDSLTITGLNLAGGVVRMNNKINITGKNNLVLDANIVAPVADDKALVLRVWSSMGTYHDTNTVASLPFIPTNQKDGLHYLDVSSLNGEYYVGFTLHAYAQVQAVVRSIYLN